MKNKVSWYINRFSTMSIMEIGYRLKQYIQSRIEKYKIRKNNFLNAEDYNNVFSMSSSISLSILPEDFIQEFSNYKHFSFFGNTIDITQSIDWHTDITSNKKFPLSFSKDINIRSDEYGNAKVVWEINRLQFLLPLAIKYRETKNDKDLIIWMNILKSWKSANPYLQGVNWYSNIEINIRLIVWYYCWQVLWSDELVRQNKIFVDFTKQIWLPTIYQHCMYSYKNPSKYSSANNHAIAEYAGLFVATCCWPFAQAKKWNKYAKKGLEKQIILQHSKNGINKEEAAEYIQFITDFFIISFAVGKQYNISFSEQYKKYLQAISTYIFNLLDIKGNYPKYGDEDDGKVLITSTNEKHNNFLSILTSATIMFHNSEFKWRAPLFDFKNWLLWGDEGRNLFASIPTNSTNLESKFYEQEGHFICRKTDIEKQKEIYLHFNAAPLGYLSIAAHGHADALSIILHIDGYPFLVDSGTYTYHTEPLWRKYFVSTPAHNTVNIDSKNQALYIGPTMWLKHYKAKIYSVSQVNISEQIRATHNGYKSIGCSHLRKIDFNKNNCEISIIDFIKVNNYSHHINIPWHLHPDINITSIDEHTYILAHQHTSTQLKITMDKQLKINIMDGQVEPINGWFSNSFLQKKPTHIITGFINTVYNQEIKCKTKIECINIK